jgi:tRNA pseudouridine55 synthase
MTGDGLVIVDKPAGLTSHDVVSRLRRLAGTRRVGHAGTLDPMATGVLVVGVNKATRLLHHLVLADKVYTATIRLGVATVTDDATGAVVSEADCTELTDAQLSAEVVALTGDIEQVPSAVSAVKVDGRRAYLRVRAGEEVTLAARHVTVSRFDVLQIRRTDAPVLDLDVSVECSSGTYVRALARDLGVRLGVGGHLTALRRTRVGPFDVAQALTMQALAERADPVMLPLATAIRQAMPVRRVDSAEATALGFGQTIEATGLDGTYGALAPDGSAVALLVESDGRARPVLVFTPAY